jgi:hypothetical protein
MSHSGIPAVSGAKRSVWLAALQTVDELAARRAYVGHGGVQRQPTDADAWEWLPRPGLGAPGRVGDGQAGTAWRSVGVLRGAMAVVMGEGLKPLTTR